MQKFLGILVGKKSVRVAVALAASLASEEGAVVCYDRVMTNIKVLEASRNLGTLAVILKLVEEAN